MLTSSDGSRSRPCWPYQRPASARRSRAHAAACNARILFTALTPSPNCFSYDPTGKQFVFNLRTPRGVTGLATITAEVFSGATVLNIASTQINLR